MTNVGVVKIQFDGDASKAEAAFAKLQKAMGQTSAATEKMAAQLSRTSSSWESASAKMARATEHGISGMERSTLAATSALAGYEVKATSVAATMQKMQDRLGKASGALAAMSSALGSGESQTAKYGQALVGVAGAFAAGGPVLAGLAAGAAALEFMTTKMKEQEAQIAKSAAAFDAFVGKYRDAKMATLGVVADTKFAADVERAAAAMKNRGESDSSVSLFRQLAPIERQRQAKEAELEELRRQTMAATTTAEVEKLNGAMANLIQELRALKNLSLETARLHRETEAAARGPSGPRQRAESAYERGIHADLAMATEGNYGRAVVVESEAPTAMDAGYDPAEASRFEREMAQAHNQSLAASTQSTRATTGLADIISRAGEGIARGALSGDPASIGAALGAAAGIPMAGMIAAVLVEAIGGLTAGLNRVADRIMSSSKGGAALSDAGGVMRSTAPLMGVGGVLLLPAIFMSALLVASTYTERFGQFAAVAGKGLDLLVSPLGFLWQILMPLAGGLVVFAQAVQPITTTMLSLMPIETVGKSLFLAFGSLATAALFAASSLAIAQRETFKFAEAILPEEQFADQIAAADAVADATWAAAQTIGSTSWEDAQRAATGVLTELGDGIAATFPDDQQNLPSGYRIPFYESEVPDGPGGGGGGAAAQTSVGAIYNLALYGPVHVDTPSPRGLTEALQREAMRSRGRPWGAPSMAKPPKKN